jgi:hypothetical protein
MNFQEFFDPETCAANVTTFLGLEEPVVPTAERQNASFVYNRPEVARFVKGQMAHKIGRALVPKVFRKSIREGIDRQLATKYQRSAVDVERLRTILADEIDACLANPLVPTDGWKSAIASCD